MPENKNPPILALPLELQIKFLSQLSPEDISSFGLISTAAYKLSRNNNLWKEKLKQYFPKAFISTLESEHKEEDRPTFCLEAFITNYKKIFGNLTKRERQFFTLVIENDWESLEEEIKNLSFDEMIDFLDTWDGENKSLLNYIQDINNPKTLDFLYKKIKQNYIQDGIIKTSLRDKKGREILIWAVLLHQDFEEITSLVFSGASLFSTSNEPSSNKSLHALLYAILSNQMQLVIKFLEQAPMLLNYTAHTDVITPLNFALSLNNMEISEFLVMKGASLDLKSGRMEDYPIHVAAGSGGEELFKMIYEATPSMLNEKNKWEKTPLICAAEKSNSKNLAFCLENKADIDARDNQQKTALCYAVENGDMETYRLLRKHGANPDVRSRFDYHPIHLAVINNRLNIVKALVHENPECLEYCSNTGDTPLLQAAKADHYAIVSYLLKKGANTEAAVNYQGHPEHGSTALCYAAAQKSSKLLHLLLKHNAKTDVGIGNGKTLPIHIATTSGSLKNIALLLKAKPETLDAEDNHNNTPLCIAVRSEEIEKVKYLLKKGANPNHSSTKNFHPPLVFAPSPELQQLLLSHPDTKRLPKKLYRVDTTLQLLQYIHKKNEQIRKEKHQSSLNPNSLFTSKSKKLAAAKALKKVAIDQKSLDLSPYKKELTHGKLNDIRQKFNITLPR